MSRANSFKHLILTRFNLVNPNWHTTRSGDPIDERWLEHRIKLFRRYCLPSVVNQSEKSFSWLIFVDINTPHAFRDIIKEVVNPFSFIIPVFCDASIISNLRCVQIQAAEYSQGYDYVLTTRLDNDDLIHRDFIANIQRNYNPIHGLLIDVRHGYQLYVDQTRQRYDLRRFYCTFNPFISLVEATDDIRTVYSKMHRDWDTHDDVRVVDHEGQWIQLVHDLNYYNHQEKILMRLHTFNPAAYGMLAFDAQPRNITYIFWANILVRLRRLYHLLRHRFASYRIS